MGSRRRGRLLLSLAAVAAVVAVLVAAQNSTVLAPEMQSYAIANERTLSLRVAVAPCSWTRVTNVVETADAVRVRVETLPCPIPLPGTAALEFRDLTVALTADLGARRVEDASGQEIRARQP